MYRILIADDEPIERKVLYRKIRKYYEGQMEIFEAENGRQAVEIFERTPCQIVILDIEMPGWNGLEAAERIRKKSEQCSIIFMTAFDEFSYAKRAITVQALDYLLKPGTDEELIAAIDEAIHRCQDVSSKESNHLPQKEVTYSVEAVKEVRGNAFKRVITEFIDQHYANDLSLQDAAKSLNYADAYFCRLFKQSFHKSFTTYLTEFRVEKAKSLLEDISINVKEISDRVGYRDSNYFTKVFKRMVGTTPTEYRLAMLERIGN